MSVFDIDRAAGKRLKDTMEACDLNDEGVMLLVTAILEGAAEELAEAARHAADNPTEANMYHLREARRWYRTEWYKALSMGVVDGETAIKKIVKNALIGRKLRGE